MPQIPVVMWENFLKALCLVFVLEGIMPFLYPKSWRRALLSLMGASDRQLRMLGLASMLLGIGLLYLLS